MSGRGENLVPARSRLYIGQSFPAAEPGRVCATSSMLPIIPIELARKMSGFINAQYMRRQRVV
jgi:hypothetical protein